MTSPPDLDEIARRRLIGDMARPEHVLLTAAERDALVAAAREIAQLRADLLVAKARIAGANLIEARLAECEKELEEAKRVPEMPADVAGLLKRLKKRHKLGSVSMMDDGDYGLAANAIESLERQRQEAVANEKAALVTIQTWMDNSKALLLRAEQAEKEIAGFKAARDAYLSVRASLGLKEGEGVITHGVEPLRAQLAVAETRLAKLEAVVAAALHGGAGTKEYDDLVALAAPDRKEP